MKRILSLVLAVLMMFTMLPVTSFAENQTHQVLWAGAMNFNQSNNYVTNASSMTATNMTGMKWAYPLNDSVIDGGA